MPEQNVGSWSETNEMRRALCKALAIHPDTSWEDAVEDARNAGIVRDAEYRAHDRISDENTRLSALLRGMARRVGTLRGNGKADEYWDRDFLSEADVLVTVVADLRAALGGTTDREAVLADWRETYSKMPQPDGTPTQLGPTMLGSKSSLPGSETPAETGGTPETCTPEEEVHDEMCRGCETCLWPDRPAGSVSTTPDLPMSASADSGAACGERGRSDG